MIDKQTSKDLSGDYTYFHKVALFLHGAPVITRFGPLANPCLCVFADGSVPQYKWQILFMTVASGDYSFDAVQPYLEQLRPLSGWDPTPWYRIPRRDSLSDKESSGVGSTI